MEEITVTKTDLARRMREILDQVRRRNVPVVVVQRGQPEVAIVAIDEYRSLVAGRERLRQIDRDEALVQQVVARCDVGRDEARLRIAEARQNVYALVEQAHQRNPDVPPEIIDVLVEEAREATQSK
jgi:prevent-host-death family protein